MEICHNHRTLHSPVGHTSSCAAGGCHAPQMPDGISLSLQGTSLAPSCSDDPAFLHPPYWWQNSLNTTESRT